MAQLTLTVADAHVPRILAAFDYDGPADAASKKEFMRQQLIDFMKVKVVLDRLEQLRSDAQTEAEAYSPDVT